MVQMIGVAPLQYNPRNSLLDTEGVVRGLNDYRRGAIEARQSEEVARAGRMSPEAGYQHLMGVGLPDQARAMGLFPLQRDALTAEAAVARARAAGMRGEESRAGHMAPWQRLLAMHQARLLNAQTGLAGVQGATARTEAETRQRFLNALMGGGDGPPSPSSLGVGLGLWNPLLMTPPTTLPPGSY